MKNLLRTVIKWLLWIIFGGALLIGLLNMIMIAVTKEETLECNKLAKYAQEYPETFFYTDWQRVMCNIEQ